jgi:hypothetical protein
MYVDEHINVIQLPRISYAYRTFEGERATVTGYGVANESREKKFHRKLYL